jgi:predicted GNAT family N-acyltransferase
MTIIKEITFQETFLVRHPVLRTGKPIESCYFKDDELATTKHFGLFKNDTLVGVASLFEEKNTLFSDVNQMQLRGMAILNTHQKQGLGEKLVIFCEAYLKSKNKSLIWFNAREIAVPFYTKLGFQVIGDSYEIDGIGTHFVMFKKNEL